MTVGATLVASLLAALDRPSIWPLTLAAFLLRGGWLLILAPIVVLPTAGGLANVLAPFLEDVVLGRRTGDLVGALLAIVGLLVAWLVGGGLLAGIAEAEAIRRVAVDLPAESQGQVVAAPEARPGRAWRIATARLVAHIPLLVALAWGAWRLVTVGYRELTVPSDVAMPVAWRIVLGAPDAIVVVAGAWLAGETIGGIAARRIVLAGRGSGAGLGDATRRVRRTLRRSSGLALATTLPVIGVLAGSALAVGTGWDAVRAAFARGDTSAATIVLIVVFVALFSGGLVLVALIVAWRSAVWTIEVGTAPNGTFGGGGSSRSGDWKGAEGSANVSDRVGPRGGPDEPEVMDDGTVDRVRHMQGRGPVRPAVVPVMRRAPGVGVAQATGRGAGGTEEHGPGFARHRGAGDIGGRGHDSSG